MNIIFCKKLRKKAEALAKAPYPGALGQQILQQISAEAWKMWINRQTLLINEYRLDVSQATARAMLETEMRKFLFEADSNTIIPPGFQELKNSAESK